MIPPLIPTMNPAMHLAAFDGGQPLILANFLSDVGIVGLIVVVLIALGFLYLLLTCYRKVEKGRALVRTGGTTAKVILNGGFVVPIIHRAEFIDISVKRIEIDRTGKNGLICQDNIRADIKVVPAAEVIK